MDDIAVRLRDMERWDVNVISPSVGRYAVEAADTIDALRARANGYYHEAATAYEQRDAAQRDAAALRARVAELEVANVGLATEAQRLKAGLRFYARGLHFSPGDEADWEDVSGEPPNFLCDEHGSTIEDGTIAKRVLLGTDTGPGWGGDDWPPPELPEEVAS